MLYSTARICLAFSQRIAFSKKISHINAGMETGIYTYDKNINQSQEPLCVLWAFPWEAHKFKMCV